MEYIKLADAENQAKLYQMFLEELGYEVTDPLLLHGDNKGSIDLTLNLVTGRKLKHIPIKYHVIWDYVENEEIKIVCTATADISRRWTHQITCKDQTLWLHIRTETSLIIKPCLDYEGMLRNMWSEDGSDWTRSVIHDSNIQAEYQGKRSEEL